MDVATKSGFPSVGHEVASRFEKRGRVPGSIYKLRDNTVALSQVVQPLCDGSRMTATATICTLTVDRDREVIIPGGGRFENYTRNPVVLWDHGMGMIAFPVGKSLHPDGSLALVQTPDSIEATCYFTNATKESEQLFALVEQRIVNATSIHVIPTARVEDDGPDGKPVSVIPEWDMLEWSWGCVGVNPEAVAKTLASGRLAGSAILPAIKSYLVPFVPARKATGVGADLLDSRLSRLEATLDKIAKAVGVFSPKH